MLSNFCTQCVIKCSVGQDIENGIAPGCQTQHRQDKSVTEKEDIWLSLEELVHQLLGVGSEWDCWSKSAHLTGRNEEHATRGGEPWPVETHSCVCTSLSWPAEPNCERGWGANWRTCAITRQPMQPE